MMKRWGVWAAVSAALLIAAMFAFISFYAAVDLGYDIYPEGKSIIAFWGYSMILSFGAAIASGVFAVHLWRRSRSRPTRRPR